MDIDDEENHRQLQLNLQQSPLLNEAFFGKPIPASKLRERIQLLSDIKVDPNYPDINGFDVEFTVSPFSFVPLWKID